MKRQIKDAAPTEDVGFPRDSGPEFLPQPVRVPLVGSPEYSDPERLSLPQVQPIQPPESPAPTDDEWSASYREWQKGVKEIERKILGCSALKDKLHLLERIEAKGAVRSHLIFILALMVSQVSPNLGLQFLAKKRDELKRLSKALETVGRQTERIISDPFCYADNWFCLLLDPSNEAYDPGDHKFRLPEKMERLARAAEVEARKIGRVMRWTRRRERRIGLVTLLGYVHTSTKTIFDTELVQLLTIAFGAVGIKRRNTIGQLRKIRERHVMPSMDKPNP